MKQVVDYLSKLLKGGDLTAVGYEKLTIGASVKGLALIPANAQYAKVRLISDAGTAAGLNILHLGATTVPTATEGIPYFNNEFWDITGADNLANFRGYQANGTSNIIYVEYYK